MSDYTLTVEVHAVDVIPGQTTYRVYQNMVNEDDFLSSVYGNNEYRSACQRPRAFITANLEVQPLAISIQRSFPFSLIWQRTAG